MFISCLRCFTFLTRAINTLVFHCAATINSIIYTRASTATATPAATSTLTSTSASTKIVFVFVGVRIFCCCLFFFPEVCRCCFLRHMHVRFTVEIFDQFKFFICNERKQIAPRRAPKKKRNRKVSANS